MPTGRPWATPLSELREVLTTLRLSPRMSLADAKFSTGLSSPSTNTYRAPVSFSTISAPGWRQAVAPPGLM